MTWNYLGASDTKTDIVPVVSKTASVVESALFVCDRADGSSDTEHVREISAKSRS